MPPIETIAAPRRRAPGQNQIVRYSCARQHYRRNLTPVERDVGVFRWPNLLSRNCCGKQHSLWSAFADVPAGWRMVYGEADRAAFLDYIEQNWTDIRTKSLCQRLAHGRGLET
jgi:uncharacterized protein YbdZ (MbtH family)